MAFAKSHFRFMGEAEYLTELDPALASFKAKKDPNATTPSLRRDNCADRLLENQFATLDRWPL
jgi:hypothetical protein